MSDFIERIDTPTQPESIDVKEINAGAFPFDWFSFDGIDDLHLKDTYNLVLDEGELTVNGQLTIEDATPNGSVANSVLVVKKDVQTAIPTLGNRVSAVFAHTPGNAENCSIAIIADNNEFSGIDFGDTDDMDIGGIRYNHNDETMEFNTNTAERLELSSSHLQSLVPVKSRRNVDDDRYGYFDSRDYDNNRGFFLGWGSTANNHVQFSLDHGDLLSVEGGTEASLTAYSGYFAVGSPTGEHLAFDIDEIQAKESSTTAGTLILNNHGGNVVIGSVDQGNQHTIRNLSTSWTLQARNYHTSSTSADVIATRIDKSTALGSGNYSIYFTRNGSIVGGVHSEVTYATFTGAHYSKQDKQDKFELIPGMIVESNGKMIQKQQSNSLCEIRVCTTEKSKTVYGVYADYMEATEEKCPENWKVGEKVLSINALGEGLVWVTDKNGEIENGDYITSSDIAGYGMKQDDDILHSYTVAKCTEHVDWSKVETGKDEYKRCLVGCTYHCG
jgi:hypothetical protein